MRLAVGRERVFAPRAWAALLTTALLAAFVSLGWWQIGRAREKQAMIASFARGTQSSVLLSGVTVDELPRYQHVTVRGGHYDTKRQILLDNMPSSTGQPGYQVLTPFLRPGSSRLLIVDRGWVPLGPSRAKLPDVHLSYDDGNTSGRLDHLPVPGMRIGPAQAPGETGWPRVLNFPTQADLESVLGEPVESRIVLLDPARPEGYERVWRPALGFPPERHLGYALQWFALAIASVVVFVSLSLQRVGGDGGSGAPE